MIVQAKRSAFITPSGATRSVDGAEPIKVHPFFRGVDWANIHRDSAPFRPDLRNPEDTRHFDDDTPPEVCWSLASV
jgi:protein-serine/threonine kinase